MLTQFFAIQIVTFLSEVGTINISIALTFRYAACGGFSQDLTGSISVLINSQPINALPTPHHQTNHWHGRTYFRVILLCFLDVNQRLMHRFLTFPIFQLQKRPTYFGVILSSFFSISNSSPSHHIFCSLRHDPHPIFHHSLTLTKSSSFLLEFVWALMMT